MSATSAALRGGLRRMGLGILAVSLFRIAYAQTAAHTAEIDALMRAYTGDVPGASVLVLQAGHPLVSRAYGFARLTDKQRATPATNYRLASMTKQFTATAVLLLAQDGRLSLDDRIKNYLPTLPATADMVTIRELLTHRGGLIDYEDLIPAGTTQQVHDVDVLRLLEREDRTYFTPGSDYRYSDTGYALLALIVARVSGVSFASFLHDHIFAPLGMDGTVAYEAGISEVPRRAYGYSLKNGHWTETDQSLTSAVLGDGGVYSSVEDLARWDTALSAPGLLKAEWLKAAFTPVTKTDDPNVSYALGWRITGDTVWHSGESVGFRNVIVRWPQQRFTVILLTNRDDADPYSLALKIAKLYLPDADRVRATQVVVGPDSGAHPLPK
jgi:CubicO group peptidase (beta-lactamase class C family)